MISKGNVISMVWPNLETWGIPVFDNVKMGNIWIIDNNFSIGQLVL